MTTRDTKSRVIIHDLQKNGDSDAGGHDDTESNELGGDSAGDNGR